LKLNKQQLLGDKKMADKDYGLYAQVGIYEFPWIDRTTRHYTLDMEAFGVRKGQELTVDQINEGGSAYMVRLLNSMKRPSPISLLWEPTPEKQGLFNEIRRKKLRIEISFVSSGNNTTQPKVESLMVIDNVRISRILYEPKNGSQRRLERIEGVFNKIELN
jgi:hypothetical protein